MTVFVWFAAAMAVLAAVGLVEDVVRQWWRERR